MCSGCQDLKKAIRELKLKKIDILNIDKHLDEAKKFKVYGVPTAVINGQKYNISRNGDCLVFKNKNDTVRVCKK